MPGTTLNLGILAHVDAGKTSLTERLLYQAGVIGELGTVDAGTTQTDSMALERRRGITIRAAVASLSIRGVTVNLIDTPGHPDFIAEVERALSVLDGAVLVVSAVEGVQPQTRILMRALRRLGVPTLLFVNKIDRRGADPDRVLSAIRKRLSPDIVAMGTVGDPGTRTARFVPSPIGTDELLTETLTRYDEELLADYVDGAGLSAARLRAELVAQTRRALVHPVFLGSAVTGAGVPELAAGIVEYLPTAAGDPGLPLAGSVFKIERGAAGEKIGYVRLSAGTLRVRDRVDPASTDKVTALHVLDNGNWVPARSAGPGEIAKVWGLHRIRVGDPVGGFADPGSKTGRPQFAPPTLEAVVRPVHERDGTALRVALGRLAEQDPLIGVEDDESGEVAVSLYGEVQKEVIQATLAEEYGIEVEFDDTTTLYVERPRRRGEALVVLHADDNPFLATIGLRIEPGPAGSGIEFRLRVPARTVPLFVYKSVDGFAVAMEQYVRRTLREGLFGWPVTDCVVTMVESNYSSPDGPPSTRGALSTAADFRKCAPLAVMRALDRAGVVVCEPVVDTSLEIPATSLGPVLSLLGRLGATVRGQHVGDDLAVVEGTLASARLAELQRLLPPATSGEGVLEFRFAGYQPVPGAAPARRRRTADPLHLQEYLLQLSRQGAR